MTNNVLNQVDSVINKNYDVIKALDNDYLIETYTPEMVVERGRYGFNIMPMIVEPRFPSAERDLVNIMIDVCMHYDMEADDSFKTAWTSFMLRAQHVLLGLYDKQNFIVGISTVDIMVDFVSTLIEQERIISLTFRCEYKLFASR